MPTVAIDCFPERARDYWEGHAIVAVDVIRATTTAMTAVDRGFRCYPVPSLEVAVPLAARLESPLLVGELGGSVPYGFESLRSTGQEADLEFVLSHVDDLDLVYALDGDELRAERFE